jgi:hypothetical protein
MFNLAQMARHPLLAGFFAAVHPIFWLVLFWQLMRAAERLTAMGCHNGGLLTVHWWGGVDITYASEPVPSLSAYRPITPAHKAWDDPCWSTPLPAEINADEPHNLFFPCDSGGSGRPRSGLTKGACALPATADTS